MGRIREIVMVKNKHGSVTIEAAVTLPIFIFCIFTIAFLIRIVYIQEKVQFALTNAANEMAMYSYLYDQTGILDTVDDVKKVTSEGKIATTENIAQMSNSFLVVQESINNVLLEFRDISEVVGNMNSGEVNFTLNNSDGGIFEKVSEAASQVAESKENIENSVKSTYASIEKGVSSFNQLASNKSNIKGFVGYEGIKSIETVLGNACIKLLMKKNLTDADLESYFIVDGYGGLDFSRSSYFVKDSDINADNVIDVIVCYKIKVPVPIKIIDEIPLVQRVTVRAWTGKSKD